MRRQVGVVAATLVLLAAGCTSGADDDDSTGAEGPGLEVDTTTGTVRGVDVGATRQWLGIRYAEPPTGERRWTLPEPAPDTDEVLDGDEGRIAVPAGRRPRARRRIGRRGLPVRERDGARARQRRAAAGDGVVARRRVHQRRRVAVRRAAARRPGRRRRGDRQLPARDARATWACPGWRGPGTSGWPTRWPRWSGPTRTPTAFGGDPDDVTVFGESAGGTSVCAALTSPAARASSTRRSSPRGRAASRGPRGTLFPGVPAVSSLISARRQRGPRPGRGRRPSGAPTPTPWRACGRCPSRRCVGQSTTFGNPLAYGTDLLPTRAGGRGRGRRRAGRPDHLGRQPRRAPLVHRRAAADRPAGDHRRDLPRPDAGVVRRRRGGRAEPLPARGVRLRPAGVVDARHRRRLGLHHDARRPRPRGGRGRGVELRVRRPHGARRERCLRLRAAPGRGARHRPAVPVRPRRRGPGHRPRAGRARRHDGPAVDVVRPHRRRPRRTASRTGRRPPPTRLPCCSSATRTSPWSTTAPSTSAPSGSRSASAEARRAGRQTPRWQSRP